MSNGLGIPESLQDALADKFGVNALSYAEQSVSTDRAVSTHLNQQLGSFSCGDTHLPLKRSPNPEFLDLGSSNPSVSSLLTFLRSQDNPTLMKYTRSATKLPLTRNNTAILFAVNRFFDAPPADSKANLIVGHAAETILLHVGPGQRRLSIIRLDRVGVRTRSISIATHARSTPPALLRAAASLPPRNTRPPATVDRLVGLNSSGDYSAAPIQLIGDEQVEPNLTFNTIRGVTVREARLTGEATRSLAFRPASISGPEKLSRFMSAHQGLRNDDADITVIAGPVYVPPTPTPVPAGPANLSYGKPGSGCSGRSSAENCVACCDGLKSTATGISSVVGGGLATAGLLAGAKVGAITGFWAGPIGVAFGTVIGAVIGFAVAYFAVDNICYGNCTKLYPTTEALRRRYQLTSVTQSETGETSGYLGIDDRGLSWALSTQEAAAAVSGGLDIFVRDAEGDASVVAVSRLGRPYIRTTRDGRLTDNISALPSGGELPDERGIALP